MTPELLSAATRCGLAAARVWAEPVTRAMTRYEIDTVLRQAAFLAQIGHESGNFVFTREVWGPTPAQAKYEGRVDLGNTEPGDGFRFRGRGLIQITGRANYEACGRALGLPLLEEPQLLEEPEFASTSAGWFWCDLKRLNALADRGEFETITRRINGGTNGAADRGVRYQRALDALQ